MLPGFRFLFAAIVLSMSILIFGLGAAALLRAAHEEFASNPSWRSAPATMFAQQTEASSPVLALLRVEPPAAEPKAPDNAAAPTAAVPAGMAAPQEAAPADSGPAEAERVATLRPEDVALKPEEEASPALAAKPENPPSQTPASQSEAAPAQTDAPAAAGEPKIAAVEPELIEPASPLANPGAATASEPATINELLAAPAPATKPARTKIAARGNPSATVETPRHPKAASPKTAGADVEEKEKEKRLQALRAKRRRMAEARARLARQQAEQMQPANPFAPFIQPTIQQPVVQPATP
jgi:hypothetical protein